MKPIEFFASASEFDAWLSTHHDKDSEVWLKFARKASGHVSMTYSEALDVALCHGWIDGQKDRIDDTFWLQRFTPRRAGSRWSKINCGRADALIAAGRMQAAGLRQIEAARSDGRWEAAYSSPKSSTIAPDFQAALDAHPNAKAFFSSLNSANRYAITYRLETARRPETRTRRIETFIAMLERGETFH